MCVFFFIASMLLNSWGSVHQGHGKLPPSEIFVEGKLKNRSGIQEEGLRLVSPTNTSIFVIRGCTGLFSVYVSTTPIEAFFLASTHFQLLASLSEPAHYLRESAVLLNIKGVKNRDFSV